MQRVCRRLLSSGVTSLCPTLVSSSPATYAAVAAVFAEHRARAAAAHAAGVAAAAKRVTEPAQLATPRPPSAQQAVRSNDGDASAARPAGDAAHFETPPAKVAPAARGTGAAAPTVADAIVKGEAALATGSSPVAGARVLGLHLEGPFIAPARKGAHALAHLRETTDGVASLALVGGWHRRGVGGGAAQDEGSFFPLGSLARQHYNHYRFSLQTYGQGLDWAAGDVRVVTIAPELPRALEVRVSSTRLSLPYARHALLHSFQVR